MNPSAVPASVQPNAVTPSNAEQSLVDQIDALLPQTQCTKCGYAGCRPYAQAIAANEAQINQCPPGGAKGIQALAGLLGRTPLPLNPTHGVEAPLRVAYIDEALCIGCTLCIQACPVDAIVGAVRKMHTVLPTECTGCDLCVAPCPMDCISMRPLTPPQTWTTQDAERARARYVSRTERLQRERAENDERLAQKAAHKLAQLNEEVASLAGSASHSEQAAVDKRKAVIEAAIERARLRRQTQPQQQPPK